MSFLVQLSHRFRKAQQDGKYQKKDQYDKETVEKCVSKLIQILQKKNIEFTCFREEVTASLLHLRILLNFEKIKLFQIVIEIKVNFSNDLFKIRANVLSNNRQSKINTPQLRKNANRLIQKINLLNQKYLTSYSIEAATGKIRIDRSESFKINIKDLAIFLIIQFQNLTHCLDFSLIYLLEKCNIIQVKIFEKFEFSKLIYQLLLDYYRQIRDIQELLTISHENIKMRDGFESASLPEDNSATLSQLIVNYSKRKNQLKQTLLYGDSVFIKFDKPENTNFTREHFKKYLTVPQPPKRQHENNFLFNTIYVKDVKEDSSFNQQLLGVGGNSKVIVKQFVFVYAESKDIAKNMSEMSLAEITGIDKQQQQDLLFESNEEEEGIKKSIAIKMPKDDSPNQLDALKITYEKKIVSMFRGAISSYFPLYYHSAQKNFKHTTHLFMEVISGDNLSEKLNSGRKSMTNRTFMNILVHFSNAIRFLEQYEVSHLDLSGRNVIVTKDLNVKIIDFGEAYKQEITEKFQKQQKIRKVPGITFPYSAPETIKRSKGFTSQQDIFSLGIIAYDMFFGKLPFLVSQSKGLDWYKQDQYIQHCYLCPQEIANYGHEKTMLLMVNLIFRCLRVKEEKRPCPTWMHIIVKKLFYLLG